MSRIPLVAIFVLCSLPAMAQSPGQQQLVILKGEKVLLRLYPGDEITYSLKGSRQMRRSYVNNLSDTSVTLHRTVVPLNQFDRIYFKRSSFANVIGGVLVTGGVGYFLVDQINVVLVHGESANLDKNVTIASAAMLGVGLPLFLFRKNYCKIGRKFRLRVVDHRSGFYRPDLRQSAFD
ncbi:MAG TPA: hypothetical protein VKZ68_04035 [Ohtaekwangia sp.]|nr:hypothetical protein [Ohtaekwangia sp.]